MNRLGAQRYARPFKCEVKPKRGGRRALTREPRAWSEGTGPRLCRPRTRLTIDL